jgi:hypothetical protein
MTTTKGPTSNFVAMQLRWPSCSDARQAEALVCCLSFKPWDMRRLIKFFAAVDFFVSTALAQVSLLRGRTWTASEAVAACPHAGCVHGASVSVP